MLEKNFFVLETGQNKLEGLSLSIFRGWYNASMKGQAYLKLSSISILSSFGLYYKHVMVINDASRVISE
jgi:hypothetical protein